MVRLWIDVPAFRAEPRMPTEDAVRSWLLIYSTNPLYTPTSWWAEVGRIIYQETKSKTKLNDELRKTAADVTAGANSDEQRLEKIYDFCRTQIKNVQDPASGLSEAQRDGFKENKSAADTLRARIGTGRDLNFLFVALATAIGFDARWAVLADRSRIAFNKDFPSPYYMTTHLSCYNVAVRVGDQWRFLDPGAVHASFGMLRWQEEGQEALISDPSYSVFVRIPGYAQRTGKRLFIEPSFFQRGLPALFTSGAREHHIFFDYAWTEEDTVTIDLPAGFELDNATGIDPFTADKVAKYDVRLAVTEDRQTLLYQRKFFFGGEGLIRFPATGYANLKTMFDLLHQRDNHQVTLKQSALAAK